MQSRIPRAVLACAIMLTSAFASQPSPVKIPEAVAAEFATRVDRYMAARKAAGPNLPTNNSPETPAAVLERRAKLREAMRVARKDAKPGEILFPGLVAILEQLFQSDAFKISGREASAMARETERPPTEESVPRVNQEYPERRGLVSPPATVLIRLPALPDALEYRIIGRHLIIRDVDSNLIVDVAPNVLPAR